MVLVLLLPAAAGAYVARLEEVREPSVASNPGNDHRVDEGGHDECAVPVSSLTSLKPPATNGFQYKKPVPNSQIESRRSRAARTSSAIGWHTDQSHLFFWFSFTYFYFFYFFSLKH